MGHSVVIALSTCLLLASRSGGGDTTGIVGALLKVNRSVEASSVG
jgi:hypothetical protein